MLVSSEFDPKILEMLYFYKNCLNEREENLGEHGWRGCGGLWVREILRRGNGIGSLGD